MENAARRAINRLNNKWPLIGHLIRARGATALVNTDSPEAVSSLITALKDKNQNVRDTAYYALTTLKGNAKEHLCNLWAEGRDKVLEEIIVKGKYIASQPVLLTARTSFLQDIKLTITLSDNDIHQLLYDSETKIVANTVDYLFELKGISGYDYLWDFIKTHPDNLVAKVLYQKGWHPEDLSERCLFYLLAGYIDQYHDIDFDQSRLRYIYETSPAVLKDAIAGHIRKSGDMRLLAIFRTERGSRKKILDNKEVSLQIEILSKNRDYPELFRLLRHATWEQGVKIITILKNAGWRHPEEHGKELQERLESFVASQPVDRKGPLPFAKTIYRDFRPMFLGSEPLPEDTNKILAWLIDDNFRRRSAALILLAEKGSPSLPDAANSASGDPYWQVRMAATAAELLNPGTLSPANRALLEADHVYWVQSLLKTPPARRLTEIGHAGFEKLKEETRLSSVSNKPQDADNFFDRIKGFVPDAEREYLVTLGEFLTREIEVSEDISYEAKETDVEIEIEE
ncbi:MAG: HEAT repeat domain-containing protein [Nitrospirota bacterium]